MEEDRTIMEMKRSSRRGTRGGPKAARHRALITCAAASLAAAAVLGVAIGPSLRAPATAASTVTASQAMTASTVTASQALRQVSRFEGVWTPPPSGGQSGETPDGPLMGNGDLGVDEEGPINNQTFYLGEENFFTG